MKRPLALLFAFLSGACIPSAEHQFAEASGFWADTDWTDPATARNPERVEARFAEYISLLEDERLTPAQTGPLLEKLLADAMTEKTNFLLLRDLCEKYLYSPESPMRNDELYLHALEPIIGAPYLNDYEKLRPRYQRNMAQRNRPGTIATDFAYMLADGRRSSLHALEAECTLVFFTDPSCGECAAAARQIQASRRIRRLERNGRLRILAMYSNPEEAVDTWRSHTDAFPESWIAVYDDGATLHYEGLYDLRRVPCFYLLDAQKRVLVKGASDLRTVLKALP